MKIIRIEWGYEGFEWWEDLSDSPEPLYGLYNVDEATGPDDFIAIFKEKQDAEQWLLYEQLG